ncbi:MAG: carboxypeptidase regulatory-like domain-containing protein [Caldilineaceae bacterium]|nr:carboxypeptidase regulatory-like domain-containing protein [Caldilineaceae bacterium]
MSSMDRFVRWLTGEEGGENPSMGDRSPIRNADGSGLLALETNAEPYGVTVETAEVMPGSRYWRATRVHHLSPQENNGRHHIYIDAVKADGTRAFNTQAHITWEGGEHTATLDKPLNEPAANFPMFKWQKCTVEMQGMPSDKVHGISSSHPDEPNPDGTQSGNTLFHHSFLVIFHEVTAPQPVTTGTIEGRVENSHEGLTVELVQAGAVTASAPVAGDGTFVFPAVEPGDYSVRLGEQSVPVQVQTNGVAQVTLTLAASGSVLEGTVPDGGGLILRLVKDGEILAEGPLGQSGAFRLRNLTAGSYHVQVLRPGQTEPLVISPTLEMDGKNRRTVDLRIPAPAAEKPNEVSAPEEAAAAPASSGSPLAHYVLFSAQDTPAVRQQMAALLPHLAEKGLGFGFDYQEAANAEQVTVIGDGNVIPEFQLIYLSTQGVKVRRLTGTPEEIAAQV